MIKTNTLASYPNFSSFSKAYSVSLSPILLEDLRKAYSDKSPTLSDVNSMYGNGTAELWVETQITGLDFTSQTKEGGDTDAIEEFSMLFARHYSWVKITEFLLFIARYKLGIYGKFYGCFDVVSIGDGFKKFLKDRNREFDKIQNEISAHIAVSQKHVEVPPGYTSISWYEELQRRAIFGDEESRQIIDLWKRSE